MSVKYVWARSLYDYLYSRYSDILANGRCGGASFKNGSLYLVNTEVDLSSFEFKNQFLEDPSTVYFDHDENLIKCVDECVELLTAVDGWSIQPLVLNIGEGGVKYQDFLPLRSKNTWKSSNVPGKLTSEIRNILKEVTSNDNIFTSVRGCTVSSFERPPLMRLYMSSEGLTLGVWDSIYGDSEDYLDIHYSDNGSSYLDGCLERVVAMVQKLGKPIRDVFILTNGSCDKMYYRRNGDGEYTITIY